MQLKDVMTRDVKVARPGDTLMDAAQKMRSLDVGPLPVTDGAKVVGVLTDRDITIRATAQGLDPKSAKVQQVMTPEVVFCYEDDDLEGAARLMSEHQLRRLIVLDRDSRLAGIVSLGDLAVDSGDEKMAGRVLNRVSTPAHPRL